MAERDEAEKEKSGENTVIQLNNKDGHLRKGMSGEPKL